MKVIRYLTFALLMLAVLTGCGKSNVGTLTQSDGNIEGTLSFDPDPFDVMSPVTLSLQLVDANGKAIDNAQVSYDLTMPAMKMPPSQPQAASQGNGLYTTQTTFSMSGDWRADVTVVQGGETTTLTFDFKVK